MSVAKSDLGVLGNLAVALGVFTPGGSPNPSWFGNPEASLKNILANDDQRAAIIAFVDEAMGGADRTTDPHGVVWLPIVSLDDPDLTVAITVDDTPPDGIHIGVGLLVRTTNPTSVSSLGVPLFRAKKDGGPSNPPFLLGTADGRIHIATSITIDSSPPTPGTARLGAVGIDIDVPTSPSDPKAPVFGLSLTGFQLPGATSPRDIRVAADGLDELDDAVLDLVLSLVRAQADAAAPTSPIGAIGGLLGLRSADSIPDFPITQLPSQGVHAIANWLHGVITTPASRSDWVGYLASLLGGTHVGDAAQFALGSATLSITLKVDTGPTGNARLSPALSISLGNATARVEAQADLFQIDLVTGSAVALPRFGMWAAAGNSGNRVLNVAGPPIARADTLRIGFGLDAQRRLTFVLAADNVVLGSHTYPTLDLTSPDAVMDAVGNTVADVANQLLSGVGPALPVVRALLGLDAPGGVTAVTLPALMTDPVGAVGGYWQSVLAIPAAATSVLGTLRDALADAGSVSGSITGTGTPLDPWRVPLVGPLGLEVSIDGPTLRVGVAVSTSVDTLGQRCTVVETRLAATIAEVNLTAKTGKLLPGVEGVLSARERGVNPPRVLLPLDNGAALSASGVGLRLGWTPSGGMSAGISAPNLKLTFGATDVPITLPVIAADGTVTLPALAWDGIEALVGYFGDIVGGVVGDIVAAFGWAPSIPVAGGLGFSGPRLRLADLMSDPTTAFKTWLPELLLSDIGPQALSLVADLFGGAGPLKGFLIGTGHPDDPYRFPLADPIPNIAVWFPPEGLERALVLAPEALRRWRPGDPGLSATAITTSLSEEAKVAADVRALIESRDVAAGIDAITLRWVGGDGRIVPPAADPDGVTVIRAGVAVGQLVGQLDLEDLTGRIPTTTVFVALGASAWPDAPAGRRVDLTAAHLDATMFTVPAAATGDWFVALGTRADSLLAGSATDGTPEQAARLARVLDALASVSTDICVVAVAGAGHAARLASEAQAAVTDLVTLGTALSAVSLTAISTQPTADALRLLNRLLPTQLVIDPADPDSAGEDPDLALGRALVGAMMELTDRADPSADLRPPIVPPATPRAGLAVTAVFGAVTESQIRRAITAIVAAGLAERARIRALTPLPPPTGVNAGLRMVVDPTSSGSLSVTGSAVLQVFSYDKTDGIDTSRHVRVRIRVVDRLAWLVATPDLELRALSADVEIPLDGASHGTATVTLHDARVFGQSWERLMLGTGAGAVPVLPEARVLLAAAIQRVTADVGGTASVALDQFLTALGIIDGAGGVVGDAVDQLVFDPGGLVRQRLLVAESALSASVSVLLGSLGASINFAARTVHAQGGDDSTGRFGWHVDVTASPTGLTGEVRFGTSTAGSAEVVLGMSPFHATLNWHQAGGATDVVTLWPNPDATAIGRVIAKAAPSLAANVALELMRRADDTARPVIDAALDALGVLGGTLGDPYRPIRPLAGLLADPAGWLRSSQSLGSGPAKIQALFDALRPLLGIAGAPGTPIALASGVSLSVGAAGGGAAIELDVDASAWTTPGGATARLAAGLGVTLTIPPSGPPSFGLESHIGLPGGAGGRPAVYVKLGPSGIELFLRPTTGADIVLIPFAGLGALAAAAEAALPFLLDQLAGLSAPTGPLVAAVGDALALRSGLPKKFDGAALHAWALDPVGQLTAALPSIVATGLNTIAPLADAFVPGAVNITVVSNTLTVAVGGVTLGWTPSSSRVSVAAPSITVPGIGAASLSVAVSSGGLEDLTVTAGPATIDAGGVTLRPFVTVAAGSAPAGGRRVAVGMAVDPAHRFAARWLIDSHTFALVASDGAIGSAVDTTDAAQVALRIVEVVADLVATVAMSQPAVTQLLNQSVGATTVRNLMRGVVLENIPSPTHLIAGMFNPATLLGRIQKLFSNIADASITITIDEFELSFTKISNVIGFQIGLTGRLPLISGDVSLWLENDDSWIEGNPSGDGGLFVGFVKDTSGTLSFTPSLVVNGVGLRIGKSSGPLLDFGITLDSIALHAFAELDTSGAKSGGVQVQFSNLAVSAGGAKGDNGIAQGVMKDTGPTPPKPAFSPALAIQKHGNDPVHVSLRAGDGDGPWWIAIQKGFGPLYLEQIGFGAKMPSGRVDSISLLMDGSVSMFGLTCAVDDLQITYLVSKGDFFNADNWAIDLAGLAVSANMAGVTIAGGLLKQTTPAGIEYLGMLLGRFAVYGITIYGGYGEGVENGEKFTSFFAVGAVNGPIGGPPAFFLTGIGGGFGINRKLIVPTDLSRFGDYPLIQALDIAASPSDPMTQLRALGQYFPMSKGTFWFAAGLSFNSFALVDGIAVVAVQIGDGLDINILGLARMALPRPQVALVSIEVALLVRFSSSEGVLWVQAQLTDNSWLLYPDVKLTGGFAYVIWFKGAHAGEFVFTLGGYHPDFHRDGYPVVPRLGLHWSIGDFIVIKAGTYFALTSEALMAGGDFEASATFGPAWAQLKFGANGIVYFDPFHYKVDAYLRIAAGITIDLGFFGELTISISLGARIEVEGPDFHGKATFEVGPIELTVEFGGEDQSQKQPIAADAFIEKYLAPAEGGGGAEAHALMTSFGALPAKGENSTPDGSAARPFVVVVEFGLTFTSTIPATKVKRQNASTTNHAPSRALGVAPMLESNVTPMITLTWMRSNAVQAFPFVASARPFGQFPVGVWGLPQDSNNQKVPKAEMIEALNELDLAAHATPSPGGPEIPYYQVEIGKRKPLPFSRRVVDISALKVEANSVAALITEPTTVPAAFAAAGAYLASTATPTALRALRGERQSPPLLGTLAERLDANDNTVIPGIGVRPSGKVYDHFVDAPIAVGMMSGATMGIRVSQPARTTVKDSQRAWRISPPTFASVESHRSASIAARLVIVEPTAVSTGRGGTVIGAVGVPPTAVAHAAPVVIARTGAPNASQLDGFNAALTGGAGIVKVAKRAKARAAAATASPGATLMPGSIVVLKMPNAHADAALEGDRPRLGVSGAPARLVILGHGGRVMVDKVVSNGGTVDVAQGTERIVAVGQGVADVDVDTGLAGWHSGMQLPYAGWSTAVGPGCVVRSSGNRLRRHRERLDAGWVAGSELAADVSTVTTTFSDPPTAVVIVLDDPAAFGNTVEGRQLLLGLDGAKRARDKRGREQPPVLLTMENRSVLAYDIIPSGRGPVVVTIASEQGWSLVGVMGSSRITAAGAIALISSRGLDASVRPLAAKPLNATAASKLTWLGPTRTPDERKDARVRASGRTSEPLKPLKPVPTKPAPSRPAPVKPVKPTVATKPAAKSKKSAAKPKVAAKKKKTVAKRKAVVKKKTVLKKKTVAKKKATTRKKRS